MKKIIATHYKKVLSTSVNQFEQDFGCYPPAPLRGDKPKTKFSIIYVTSLGKVVYQIDMIRRLVNSDESSKSSVFIKDESLIKLAESIKKTRRVFYDSKFSFLSLGFIKRIFVALVFLATLPFILIPLLFISFRLIYIFMRLAFKKSETHGEFLAVLNNEHEILINSKIKGSEREEAVKSHEHIHLVQYLSRIDSSYNNENKSNLKNPQDIIDSVFLDNRYINYLFEMDETEARLHEVVLSYYRARGSLPLTLSGFFDMLATAHNLGELVRKVCGDGSDLFGSSSINRVFYFVRDDNTATDLMYLIVSIANGDLQKRFILEVLPVMYGRLIMYYGDSISGIDFLAQIDRPNIYDKFYSQFSE